MTEPRSSRQPARSWSEHRSTLSRTSWPSPRPRVFPFALISDPDKSIGRLYHAEREPGEDYYEYGLPRRVTYLIDPEGQIATAYDLAGQDLAGHAAQVLADIRSRSG